MTSPPPPHDGLLELPPELRNRIFELVLVKPYRIPIVKGQSEDPSRHMLGVCRQIYQEAAAMYYSANRFGFHCVDSDIVQIRRSVHNLTAWLKRIGGKHRALLSDIHVWLNDPESFSLPDRFESLSTLNSMLAREGVWLPSTVLRVRAETEYLDQSEMEVAAQADGVDENEEHDCWRPKDPSIRHWRLLPKNEGLDCEIMDLMLCYECNAKDVVRHCGKHSKSIAPAPFMKFRINLDFGVDDDALDTCDFGSFSTGDSQPVSDALSPRLDEDADGDAGREAVTEILD